MQKLFSQFEKHISEVAKTGFKVTKAGFEVTKAGFEVTKAGFKVAKSRFSQLKIRDYSVDPGQAAQFGTITPQSKIPNLKSKMKWRSPLHNFLHHGCFPLHLEVFFQAKCSKPTTSAPWKCDQHNQEANSHTAQPVHELEELSPVAIYFVTRVFGWLVV